MFVNRNRKKATLESLPRYWQAVSIPNGWFKIVSKIVFYLNIIYLNTRRDYLSASLHRVVCSWHWKPTCCPGKCPFLSSLPTKVLFPSPGVPGCCSLDPGEDGEMEMISLVPGREWNCRSQQKEAAWGQVGLHCSKTLVITATEKCNKNMLRISKL